MCKAARDGLTARMLAGKGVPSVIGISPPSFPGSRTPITRSTPFTTFAFVDYVLPGDGADVLDGAGEVPELIRSQRREERNLGQLIDRNHEALTRSPAQLPAAWATQAMAAA